MHPTDPPGDHPRDVILTDYVDDALAPEKRAEVDQHLARCEECRALVDDQRAIRDAAKTLGVLEPPVRAWGRLERAISLEPSHAAESQSTARFSFDRWVWLAGAAAAVVLAAVVGWRLLPASRSTAPAGPASTASASADASAQSVAAELQAAEEHYEKAIS